MVSLPLVTVGSASPVALASAVAEVVLLEVVPPAHAPSAMTAVAAIATSADLRKRILGRTTCAPYEDIGTEQF